LTAATGRCFPSGVPFEGRQPNSKPRRNEAYKELSLLPHNFIELLVVILIWSNKKSRLTCTVVQKYTLCFYEVCDICDMRYAGFDHRLWAITVPDLPVPGYLFINTCRSVILRVEGV
jgi:hypothetical protein